MPNLTIQRVKGQEFFFFKPLSKKADEVKEDLGGRWSTSLQGYLLPPLVATVEGLYRLYGQNSIALDEEIQLRYFSPQGFPIDASIREWEKDFPEVAKIMYKYQKSSVDFLIANPLPGAYLGLSPGLGKTLVSLTAAQKFKRVLLIVPKSLMFNWQQELLKWFNRDAPITWQRGPAETGWSITSYETVKKFKAQYSQFWDLIICDEAIMLKSRKSERSDVMVDVREKADRVWALSGSPVSKYADDLYMQFKILYPKAFPSYWRFARTYCYLEKTKWGDKVTGTKRNVDLTREFRDLKLTISQDDVLPDLPEYLFEHVSVEMTEEQSRLYWQMYDFFIAQLEDESAEMTTATKVAQLVRLQQIVSNPINFGEEWPNTSGKADTVIELLKQPDTQYPMIIWGHWTEGLKSLQQRILRETTASCELVTGGMKNQGELIQLYKLGKIDVLILSLGVGKYGHTLTNTKTVVYYDRTWDADAYIQSLARVRRIGLTWRPVVYILKSPGTTDQLIEDNLGDKAYSISKASNSDLLKLLRSLHSERSNT